MHRPHAKTQKDMNIKYLALATALIAVCCGPNRPKPFGPVPTPQQLAWHQKEMNMFVHFGPNTFSGLEWGQGTESNDLFAPDSLDCRQWAQVAKEAGFGGIIITAKHHDGFSLWDNPSSEHSVANSKWRDGNGDVLAELSAACEEAGIGFGVYLSPWDRNHPDYGTERYNDAYVKSLESVLTGYGPLFEVWFDGACGEGPDGRKQVYDWPLFLGKVKEHQGDVVTFSNIGPGCRWVGNEEGHANETNWNTFTPEAHNADRSNLPGDYEHYLGSGDEGGAYWIPAEVDVSIRPGWFWRESENDKVKTPRELIDIYYKSVGRGAVLLLNVPPTASGRIHPNDIAALKGFRAELDRIFSDNIATSFECKEQDGLPMVMITANPDKPFNRLVLQEDIALGQRVAEFAVDVPDGDGWMEIGCGTTIGNKRILLLPETNASKVRVRIIKTLAPPVIKNAGLYMD